MVSTCHINVHDKQTLRHLPIYKATQHNSMKSANPRRVREALKKRTRYVTESIRKTTKAIALHATLLCQVACNRPLDFERTRKGRPVFEISGEMSLHRRHMMSR